MPIGITWTDRELGRFLYLLRVKIMDTVSPQVHASLTVRS